MQTETGTKINFYYRVCADVQSEQKDALNKRTVNLKRISKP